MSVHWAVGSAVRAVGLCEMLIHWPRFVPNLLGTNDRCRESVPTTLAAASLRQLITRILFIAAESTFRVITGIIMSGQYEKSTVDKENVASSSRV